MTAQGYAGTACNNCAPGFISIDGICVLNHMGPSDRGLPEPEGNPPNSTVEPPDNSSKPDTEGPSTGNKTMDILLWIIAGILSFLCALVGSFIHNKRKSRRTHQDLDTKETVNTNVSSRIRSLDQVRMKRMLQKEREKIRANSSHFQDSGPHRSAASARLFSGLSPDTPKQCVSFLTD